MKCIDTMNRTEIEGVGWIRPTLTPSEVEVFKPIRFDCLICYDKGVIIGKIWQKNGWIEVIKACPYCKRGFENRVDGRFPENTLIYDPPA